LIAKTCPVFFFAPVATWTSAEEWIFSPETVYLGTWDKRGERG
jgi:hypothetical protein